MHRSDRREWEQCPSFAKGLVDDIFFAFRTPYEGKTSFTVQSVLDYAKGKNWNLGFWIDLTASLKYYSRSSVTCHGLQYLKIPVTGKFGPPKLAFETFVQACDEFIEKNPGKAIGVHCTNGFNRTGYMITGYLAHSRKWSIHSALETFAECRPPGIYSQGMVDNLIHYNGNEYTPPAPKVSLPFWDNDYKKEGGNNADRIKEKLGALAPVSTVSLPLRNNEHVEDGVCLCTDCVANQFGALGIQERK